MNLQLQGRRALVTGSTAGIGFAIARELAAEGASVIINGRSFERVEAARERILAEFPQANVQGITADLATAEGAKTLLQSLPEVDILVNNLGIFDPRPFEQIDDDEWLRFFDVNVMSGVRLSRHYLPRMKAAGWG